MTEILEIKRNIRNRIDDMPESKLYALKSFLDELDAENDPDDVLSPDEEILLEECRRNRKEHPEDFISWSEIRAKRE